jgi:hypothetical protein
MASHTTIFGKDSLTGFGVTFTQGGWIGQGLATGVITGGKPDRKDKKYHQVTNLRR